VPAQHGLVWRAPTLDDAEATHRETWLHGIRMVRGG
jgi:hypothetical protein